MQFKTTTIDHRGEPFQLPFIVYEATSSYLYSLIDYDTASRFCKQENYVPVAIRTSDGRRNAVCVVAAIDYKRTSACPYHEWMLGILVTPRGNEAPELDFINETSLFFQGMLDDELIGNTVFCLKLVLDEALPTEIGFEYYGLPKELGEVEYRRTQQVTEFSVCTKDKPWIMKASVPSRRGNKLGILASLIKAYGLQSVIHSLRKKESLGTLAGSTKILAKDGDMKIKIDPKSQLFPWKAQDCKMEINPDSEWGKILLELKLKPMLVSHVPNLQFELSEPFDQQKI